MSMIHLKLILMYCVRVRSKLKKIWLSKFQLTKFLLCISSKGCAIWQILWRASYLGLPEAPLSSLLVGDITTQAKVSSPVPRASSRNTAASDSLLLGGRGWALRPCPHAQLSRISEGLQSLGKPSNNITMATMNELSAWSLYCCLPPLLLSSLHNFAEPKESLMWSCSQLPGLTPPG